MDEPIPFLVGTGQLPYKQMRTASSVLSLLWGGELIQHCCGENPRNVLQSLKRQKGLVQLSGDAGVEHPDGGSWLEALGAWRQPTVLMSLPSMSGEISGQAAAYVALCSVLSVPLLGIVQIGGAWNSLKRRADGLPWCGYLPGDSALKNNSSLGEISSNSYNLLEFSDVYTLLQLRLIQI